MPASHARTYRLPEKSELGRDVRGIVGGLAGTLLSASGLSFFLLLKGQCRPVELSRPLLQDTELFEGRCASGHSEEQLLKRTPGRKELPEWIDLELFSVPTIRRGVLQPRLLLLPLILA